MHDEDVASPSYLIVRLGALGDIVHALPAAAALRGARPGARIDWLADVRHRPLLELVHGITHRLFVDTRRWTGPEGIAGVISRLRQARYDVAFDLQGLLKSAVLARLSGAARIVGFDRDHVRERLASRLYTDCVDPGARTHVVHRGLTLVEAVGVTPGSAPMFPLRTPASDAPDKVRRSLGLGPDAGFLVLNPGAAWPNKRWPAERFGAAAAAVHAQVGLRAIVLWGPGEDTLAAEVARSSAGAAVPAPPTTMTDLVAVLAAARIVVSGDTGPLHLAAALGTPLVGIFGPTDPRRNGPWAPADICVSRSPQCHCSHQRRCTAPHWCLDAVGVSEVVGAITDRLART